MIIDDEPTALTLKDHESANVNKNLGELFPWPTLVVNCDALASSNGVATTRAMMENMLSDQITSADREWIIEENHKLPRNYAAALLFNHSL